MYLEFEDGSRRHVGRTGSFAPVLEGGGTLYRVNDGKDYAVTGTKGYSWIEREIAIERSSRCEGLDVDMRYFEELAEDAIKTIEEFVPLDQLLN